MQIIVRNYYLMMSPFVIGLLVYCLIINSIRPLIMFIIFAIAGVIGETVADAWWRMFYHRPLWVYKAETVFHGYTSWLNFIPWGIGGFLYVYIAKLGIGEQLYLNLEISGLMFAALISLQVFLFQVFKPSLGFKFHKVTLASFSFFYLPIFLFIMFLAWKYGSEMVVLALLFASIPTFVEYFFGKISELLISKKLWDYSYLSIDRGHFTPLSVPLFSLGGFYFWIISRMFV